VSVQTVALGVLHNGALESTLWKLRERKANTNELARMAQDTVTVRDIPRWEPTIAQQTQARDAKMLLGPIDSASERIIRVVRRTIDEAIGFTDFRPIYEVHGSLLCCYPLRIPLLFSQRKQFLLGILKNIHEPSIIVDRILEDFEQDCLYLYSLLIVPLSLICSHLPKALFHKSLG
jgi:hypothetical protein